jgi:hypothetical protein
MSGGSSGGTASGGSVGTASGGATGTASGGATGTASGGATGTASGGATGTGTGGATGTASGGATGTGTGGAPVAGGALTVTAGYATNGTFKGYGYTFTGPATGSTATVAPAKFTTETSLCASGMIGPDTTYASVVGMGMNVNQEVGTTAAEPPAMTVATAGTGLTINVGSVTGLTLSPGVGSQLRAQVKTATGDFCAPLPAMGPQTIPWAMFNSKCWNTAEAGAVAFTAGTPIKAVELIVPSSTTMVGPFMFCLVDAK